MSKENIKDTYYCTFEYSHQERCVVSNDSLGFFENGFWLNRQMELTTKYDDERFVFIPPHRILYITRGRY